MCNREARRRIATVADKRSTGDAAPPEGIDESAVWTFRVMLLGSISFMFLLVLTRYFLTEASECIMGMLLTMVALYPLGYIMGRLIPKRMIHYPRLGLEFSVNQGPFALREYAMISVLANLGATIGCFNSHSIDFS